MNRDDLMAAAREASSRAHAPYSHYHVGAALLDEQGRLFTGVNVENASYGATICAERTAVVSMVAAGGKAVSAIAVYTRDAGRPCGMCLQVLSEFASGEMPVHLGDSSGAIETFEFRDLLPHRFELR